MILVKSLGILEKCEKGYMKEFLILKKIVVYLSKLKGYFRIVEVYLKSFWKIPFEI